MNEEKVMEERILEILKMLVAMKSVTCSEKNRNLPGGLQTFSQGCLISRIIPRTQASMPYLTILTAERSLMLC